MMRDDGDFWWRDGAVENFGGAGRVVSRLIVGKDGDADVEVVGGFFDGHLGQEEEVDGGVVSSSLLGSTGLEGLHERTEDWLHGDIGRRSVESTGDVHGAVGASDVVGIETVYKLLVIRYVVRAELSDR